MSFDDEEDEEEEEERNRISLISKGNYMSEIAFESEKREEKEI